MSRTLLLPLATILALASGIGLLGVATTLTQAPIAIAPATSTAVATFAATPVPDALPQPEPLVADIPVELQSGPAILKLSSRTVPPGSLISPIVASEPTVLIVETGVIGVGTDGATWAGNGLDGTQAGTVLRRGEQVVIHPGTVYAVRNDSATSATVFVITIEPVTDPSGRHDSLSP